MSTEEMKKLEEALEKHTSEFNPVPVYTQVNATWENVDVVNSHYHEPNDSCVANVKYGDSTRGVWFKERGDKTDKKTITIMEVEATREVTTPGFEVSVGATKLIAV